MDDFKSIGEVRAENKVNTSDIKTLCNWKNGKANPTAEFWEAWNKYKSFLNRHGVSVCRQNDEWVCAWNKTSFKVGFEAPFEIAKEDEREQPAPRKKYFRRGTPLAGETAYCRALRLGILRDEL